MKQLYNTPEKRTITRLFLWFLLIAGNVHFYYAQNVPWAIESVSRGETMAFVAFLDVCMFLTLISWQNWDGFEKGIGLRYFFSFGLAVLSYVVFYPAYFNAVHAVKEIIEIYTLSGHPVVLTGYAVLASIAAFWTFTGMFPTEAWDILRGRERQNRLVSWIHSVSSSLKAWAETKRLGRLVIVPDQKTEPEKAPVLSQQGIGQ